MIEREFRHGIETTERNFRYSGWKKAVKRAGVGRARRVIIYSLPGRGSGEGPDRTGPSPLPTL